MASDRLAGPVGRLGRAKLHLDQLAAECESFVNEHEPPYTVSSTRDAKRGRYSFRVHIRREPPLGLSFLAGDFVHNARAALDNIVWALAPRRVRDRYPSFPIHSKPADFTRKALPMLAGMNRSVIDAIEWCQPYHGDAHIQSAYRLSDLHQLWNFDKHRAPLAVGCATHLAGYALFYDGEDFPLLRVHMDRVLKEGAEIGWIPKHPALSDDFKPQFRFFVSFVGKDKRPIPYFGLVRAHELIARDVVGAVRKAL